MDSSSCMGVMAVVAVSGSVALLSLQMHKRLENEFRRRVELEFAPGGRERCKTGTKKKKKVRFADDVVEPSSSDNKNYRRSHLSRSTVAANRTCPAT